jgi:hypothetical protein
LNSASDERLQKENCFRLNFDDIEGKLV